MSNTFYTVTTVYYNEDRIEDVAPFIFLYRTLDEAKKASDAAEREEFDQIYMDEAEEDKVAYEPLNWAEPNGSIIVGDNGNMEDRTEYHVTLVSFEK